MLSPEEVQSTLAELRQSVERLSEYFEEQAAAPPPVPLVAAAAPPALADEEREEKEKQLKELEERVAQAESRVATAGQDVADLEGKRAAVTALIDQEKETLTRLEADLARAEETIKAAAQHAETAAQLAEREQALAERERALEGGVAEIARWSAASEAANHLKEKLWPAWLRAGNLAVWKEKLETAVASGSATPAAALLFAALHGYTAATRDADLKLLHDSLREVSRRLFPWLKENGLDEAQAVETAGLWAAEVNRECDARAEVELPEIGAPATNQWMIFRPRPGVNSPDVASVQTWCVRNAQKQPVHRAEITV